MPELVYPELSFKIIGILFDIHNEIGGGHKEKYIQKAIENALKKEKIPFQKELRCPLIYDDKEIGKYFLDFLIDNKIVLEIKVGERFKKEYFNQVFSYLKAKKLKLGILVNFTREKVRFRRILNIR